MSSHTPQQRILVTGSGGQLGTELLRLFADQAIGLDLPHLDITDRKSVEAAFEQHRPHVAINAAAFTQVDLAESEPERCREVNLHGVENLLHACNWMDASIVQISTDYVFDGRQTSPYRESDQANPLNTYGRSKWEAEQIVASYPHHLIVRTAGLFGTGGPTASRNFADTMIKLAKQQTPLRVVDDQVTSFTYARDLALAIQSLLNTAATGLFHVANPGSASWYDFALEIFRIANLSPEIDPVPMAEYHCAADRPQFSALATQKYSSTPGHYPMSPWEEALSPFLSRRLRETSY